MRVWIDILTPKQVYFFDELNRRLEADGHDVFKTTRRYREVNELMELRGISAVVVGKHGGRTLEGKLIASARRIAALTRIITRLKPDLAISFSSPEAARTAFGLGIPHYAVNDSPHATAVARLTIPLSRRLFSPKIIPVKSWVELGATPGAIVQYSALDPIVWLKKMVPNPSVLDGLRLDGTRPIVVFRAEEAFASYLLGHVSERESVIIPIINTLLAKYDRPLQIVALPRYKGQVPAIRAALRNRVIVPRRVVDGPSLLFFSSVFIGAGGTMTAEAALLGVPTISCYPREPTLVEKYLIGEGLVFRTTDPERASRRLIQVLEDLDDLRRMQQERARALTSTMDDPLDVIVGTIEADFGL